MGKTLFKKVWDAHQVKQIDAERSQLFIGLHLVHEVTSPQAFSMLKEQGLKVKYPELTFATVDHIVPTLDQSRPLKDARAEEMFRHLKSNTQEHGIRYFDIGSGNQGIVHVIGPELGLTRPGMTIVCGDSHTATHGAFGAVAFGIGTSQVRDVLATQTLIMEPLKVRRIQLDGELLAGVTAKDVILKIIQLLGVKGGQGYAYEYCGAVVDNMTMDQRMTLCNMSIEGGARCGYVNPDQTTIDYLQNRQYSKRAIDWEQTCDKWLSWKSDEDAVWDDVVVIDCCAIEPTVTWGVNPSQSINIGGNIPVPAQPEDELVNDALAYMGFQPGALLKEQAIDVAFIGSCTNGRLEDFQQVAAVLKGKSVASGVKALAVPGSELVDRQARAAGIHKIFEDAGFEWRKPGCSMCLAMNPDRLIGDQVAVSTSNRNFKGRQGSKNGRTLLMSPLSVAASAIKGFVADPREVFTL